MRVLLVADFYPPYVGGVEFQVQALGRALVQRGHAVDVAVPAQAGQRGVRNDQGVIVHSLRTAATVVPWFSGSPDRRYHPPAPDPLFSLHLARLIRRTHPDAVMAHGWSAYSAAAALLGTDVPLVLSVRDYGYTCPTRNMLLNGRICDGPAAGKCLRHAAESYGPLKGISASAGVGLGRGLLRRKVTALHAVSRYVGTIMERDLLGASSLPIVTIADIVLDEPDAVNGPGGATHSRLPGEPYILFVGALQRHKGIAALLAAYGRLPEPPPLVLIGTSWPDTPKTFPDGVTVLQDVPHTEVMRAWTGALFGVAPSIWPDPLPGVVREAMIMGRPVIGSSVGGLLDIITDEEDGLLVPPGNPVALANAMQRLIDDPDLRRRLGANAARSAQRYTPDSIAAQFETFLTSLHEAGAVQPGPGNTLRALPETVPSRVHVIGGSGSGKSTVARRLAQAIGAPLHELDAIAPGSAADAREASRALAREIADGPTWVSEGIHVGWTTDLIEAADLVIWLDDTSEQQAVARISRRFITGWVEESRRLGPRRLFRPRRYVHHTRAYLRSVREIRRYRTPDVPEADSRSAAMRELAPYTGKVFRVGGPADRAALDRWLTEIETRTEQGDPTPEPLPALAGEGADRP